MAQETLVRLMANDNMLNISVQLAGRQYPLTVTAEEREVVQGLVAILNTEYDELHHRFASKLNKQDLLSMLLLTYAKKLHDAQQQNSKNDIGDIDGRINKLEKVLDLALAR